MSPLVITLLVFGGVTGLVIAVAMLWSGDKEADVEDRLSALTSGKAVKGRGGKESGDKENDLLAATWNRGAGAFEQALANHLNLERLFAQADVSFSVSQFLMACVGAALLGFFAPTTLGLPIKFAPICSVVFVFIPFAWLIMKRKRRMKKFAAQLPEALELVARALRAGHSLGAGMNLVGAEMSPPICQEFSRCFEEQNLGMPLDEALENLTERVPNLDLKFFATAVILQRQTGGDLAEILDKIGRLIRERFKIWGQVQALTGEGRLSGIVLLALPPMLFGAVYRLNPDYLMLLFTDDMGKKMLIGGIVMQLLGAIVIQKIVNIRI
ncbi:Bacterial type II secretion system protein F domain protein [Botrimarina colliarenosi]|uniref:Bacterial type II secretion system protein F domain protein n=1 Tax=Botrimarina colliarenosi TaxID=2528001 RepID=A0A5C6A9I5_9BACT|nr:type II secretion system F family protein [Botrimarina colliarenosi]TWT95978.1 Bacterial type II secretion system protein F domain protein [Botrimarina colliarenosi]